MKELPGYLPEGMTIAPLEKAPPPEQWDDWVEFDAKAWPRKVEKHFAVVPTTCFNCEAACGLLAFVDKKDWSVRRMEGNPYHPASRGRNCAKGPATVNQIQDPERILYPLKRTGKRGEGKWQRVGWDQVLDEISSEIRKLILEGRRNEIMYHVGRPGHDGYMERVLRAWGIDGHNSHTNVCSAAARLGYDALAGTRPSLAGPRQRPVYSHDQLASGDRALFQSARAENHRGQAQRSENRRDGYAPLQYRQHGRLLAPDLSRNGSGCPARHGPHFVIGRSDRPGFCPPLDQLAAVHVRREGEAGSELRRIPRFRFRRSIRNSPRSSPSRKAGFRPGRLSRWLARSAARAPRLLPTSGGAPRAATWADGRSLAPWSF